MDKKEIIVSVLIVVVAVIIGSIIFAPSDEAAYTTIDVLNKGDIGENGTIYVKLVDNEKNSLSNEKLHVKLTNSKGKVVFEDTVETHATGVAIAKVSNVSTGTYNLNITFDGDENYTSSSVSQKITIKEGDVEEVVENSTLVEETLDEAGDTTTTVTSDTSSSQSTSYSSSSYSSNYNSGSSSSSSSSSGSSSSYSGYTDENGNQMTPTYDENGKEVDPTSV